MLAIGIGERVSVRVGMSEESPSSSMCADSKSQERGGWVSEGLVRKTIRF